jgi:lysyl-tRNA synthetase class 2
LQNEELKNRKRYLDFLVNPEEKNKILIRANILRYMREFLYKHEFVEVETPVLENVASGAAAKPFTTHINAYDMDMYLRIACGELWQKRLLIGGFEKIFEMGRVFRNEGVDREHNPEFTMIEYYWAYADARDNISFHNELIPFIVKQSTGGLKIVHNEETIDFTGPYPQITFRDAVLEHSGIDIDQCPTVDLLRAAMKKKKLEIEPNAARGKLLDSLYKQTTRPKLRQPTFVLNYPVELKPLAKKAADPRYTDMFQLIVAGFELSNSYTELNDPIDQRERFAEQTKLAAGGEEEVMGADLDFVEALEHGMPPATGTGIGIDRFATLISGSHSIREVTAFPLVRPSVE